MNDAELEKHFKEVNENFEVIAKALADQHLLTIRMMSHQQAHLAALRNMMIQNGEDRVRLNQRLRNAYETAVNLYHAQLEAYYKSGDAKAFVESLVFPDEVQGN
ncbi:MAG: hypothetical protein ABSD57_09125 [Verrucomicrobiota bacterium]|jgi:hypothetical protein